MNLENKVTVVTGASRGIGASIADYLGEKGAIVIGTATSNSGAEAISKRLAEKGLQGEGMALNVVDAASVASFYTALNEKYGAAQILVNNAGITKDNILMRMSDEEWFDVVNTNLSAIYRMSKGCLRGMMKARWGRIVNISSVVGQMGNAGQTNYSATKAGVMGFTRSLAKEIGSRNITVNAVAPGFIDTDMTRELTEEQKRTLLSTIPLGRLGDPLEIARVVGFLCSEDASYITGETVHVNGGMHMC